MVRKFTKMDQLWTTIDAKSGHNVNNTLNDKIHLASLVWPVARKRDAYMMMLRHSAILKKEAIAKLTH